MATDKRPHIEPPESRSGRTRWGCLLGFVVALGLLYFLQKMGCSPLQTHEDVQMID
ncbi:MAG: hypothetical protein KatS3mg029_0694 [Saprospiraceae bacterium]|nr:MAG: hypothetical protein KatS3mg029_0694 [Saprospiraceae bacterium]